MMERERVTRDTRFDRYKVLTFDVVGTLIDSEAGIVNYISRTSGRDEASLPAEAILDAFRRARDHAPPVSFRRQLPTMYRVMAAELDLPTSKGEAEGFPGSMPYWPAFEDAAESLAKLRERFQLVAMTNADRESFDEMEKTLGSPFDDSISADDVGVEKPDPQFFAYARGRLSVRGYTFSDWLHVAQSQYHDIGVAKRLGFDVCWIERRHDKPGYGASPTPASFTEPDYHFPSMAVFCEAAG